MQIQLVQPPGLVRSLKRTKATEFPGFALLGGSIAKIRKRPAKQTIVTNFFTKAGQNT